MRGLCYEAPSQPVAHLRCSLATRPNQLLSARDLPPLVICAVGAHYETRSRDLNLIVHYSRVNHVPAPRHHLLGGLSMNGGHGESC